MEALTMPGGEKAGSYDFRDLELGKARRVAHPWFWHNGRDMATDLPSFDDNFSWVKREVRHHRRPRAHMPVLEENDRAMLGDFLSARGLRIRARQAVAEHLHPSQSNLYFDKTVGNIARQGPKSEMDFVLNNHLYVTADDHIMDGTHRWGIAMMVDPRTRLNLWSIDATVEELVPKLLTFTRHMGRSANT